MKKLRDSVVFLIVGEVNARRLAISEQKETAPQQYDG